MPSALSLFPADIPVSIDESMPLCYLHQRAMWLRETIFTYYSDEALARTKHLCPRDPDKFLKIRRLRDRQLSETESRIHEIETTSAYHAFLRAVFT